MNRNKTNIVLIGMAGSGKSTIGKLLADRLSCCFVDTDRLIEDNLETPLQDLIDRAGPDEFRKIEENMLLSLDTDRTVIATGGSSVYSRKGMEHLREKGYVVLLDVGLAVLEKRVLNTATRGLVRQPEQSFAGLYHERKPLYLRFADLIFSTSEMSPEQAGTKLLDILSREGWIG